MAYWLAYINVILAVFNLLPGFPLDGGRVLRATIWHFSGNYMKATRYATQSGRFIGYLLIAGGIALMFFNENLISGIWLIFIGWFLANTAQMSYRQARMQEVLRGYKASQVMIADCPVVDGDTKVAVLKEQYTASGSHCFFISEADRMVGFVTSHNIEAVSLQESETTHLRDIAIPLDMTQAANPDQDVLSIVQQMNEKNISQMPVLSSGQLVGIIILDDVIQFVTSHSPLKIMQGR
jgi:predicted transcriptional regulator